jgi:hypothetical protein
MIVCIEETTDSRHPETRITTAASVDAAKRWLAGGGGYAWDGAAREDLPPSQQNHHRRLRYAYRMPPGWRMPTKKRIESARGPRPWEDRRSDATVRASIVRRECQEEVPHG